MSDLYLDADETAKDIDRFIDNDTLFDVFEDFDDLISIIRKAIVNFEQAEYIIKGCKERFSISDQFEVIRHLSIVFSDDKTKKVDEVLEFLRLIHKNLKFKTIKAVYNHICDMDDNISSLKEDIEISQKNSQELIDSLLKKSEEQRSITKINKNIEKLKKLSITIEDQQNFLKIYHIFEDIAEEYDAEAMKFGIEQNYLNAIHHGSNILVYSAVKNNFHLTRMLVKFGADPSFRGYNKKNAFHFYCWKGNLEALKFLSTFPGFDPNIANINNFTPLMCACSENQVEVVKYLLTFPNIRVNERATGGFPNGKTALSLARCEEVKNLLIKHGATE